MNIWHDINPERIKEDEFEVFIEISKGSKVKYELDKETGLIALDRVLYTSMAYPASYGFIPRTLGGDGDPLDVLVLCSEVIMPGALVSAKPIGMLVMVDGGEMDEKVIAVAKNDPFYKDYTDVKELPAHYVDEMIHFMSHYKDLQKKKVEVKGLSTKADMKKVINESILNYNKTFFGKK